MSTTSPLRNRSRSPPTTDTIPGSADSMDPTATESSGLLLDNDAETGGAPPGDPSSGSNDEEQVRQAWQEQLGNMQSIACFVSHGLALAAAMCVIWWVHLLGGLSWKTGQSKLVFNWHPLLMILAFCFMTVASLSFRSPYKSNNRWVIKLLHGSAWGVAAIFALVALVAVFKSHNDSVSGYIANLYSLHSWLGMGVIGLYVLQFLAGFFTFGWTLSSITPAMKVKAIVIHKFLGPFIYMVTAATILLGIQEKEGFVKCSYSVTKADLFPLSHIGEIPPVCLVSHSLGILVLAIVLSTSFALHDFGGR
jgi:cytochrome b-561